MAAPARDPELWARLQAYRFDPEPVERGFADRLAEECGWTAETAERALEEYRRFVYLAMTAGHHVTPSVAVDLVWHLHLTYSRSYWDRFCGEVLGRPLHHEPTPGGPRAQERYREQYAATLAAYRKAFGEEPPEVFWPHPDRRFAPGAQPRLYTPKTHVALRKGHVFVGFVFVGAWTMVLVGDVTFKFLGAALAVFLVIGLLTERGRRRRSAADGGCGGVGLEVSGCGSDGGDGGGCGD